MSDMYDYFRSTSGVWVKDPYKHIMLVGVDPYRNVCYIEDSKSLKSLVQLIGSDNRGLFDSVLVCGELLDKIKSIEYVK